MPADRIRCDRCGDWIPADPRSVGHHLHELASGPVCDECFDELCDSEDLGHAG